MRFTKRLRGFSATSLLLAALPVPGICQASRVVVVNVADATTHVLIEEAEVSLSELGSTKHTDIVGEATFSSVPPARYNLAVRRLGYAPLTTIVDVGEPDTLRVTMLLVRAAAVLDTVRTSASPLPTYLRGFDARRKEGLGYFATAADLKPYWDGNLGTAIAVARHLPVQYGGGQHSDGSWRSCLFVDGSRFSGDDSAIRITEIAGIEVYTSAPPVEFSGAGCVGVVVVWLKHGGS